ncbi:histidine kinase [Conexibacter sp. CPCC 206217]|uniref:histidine kinase n=1 Tax=Conexibacter sp. CPCC 206217 TaxID=3064574 RepID=UPI002716F3B8|nr:histidine kinase [Conexibacter sp. CPCC 206217]MDO8212712.1 histidine kinase [Conexibacter sp. CPCC 206217]
MSTSTDNGAAGRPDGDEYEVTLALHGMIVGLVGGVVTIVWAVTGAGYFWPMWAWLGLLITLAIHVLGRHLVDALEGRARPLAVHAEVTIFICGLELVIWAMTGGGYFWPIWPLVGFGSILGVHWLLVNRELLPTRRERQLTERVDVLTRTRRGALDVQAAELRRIERDLHDGAQARLVALSMQLGRAEERLEDQPEVAALVRQARGEAGAAIKELRDLARGIAPPVLADRGLVAAVESLGQRSPVPVTVDAQIDRRLLPVVETAAYFVVAEALTNVAKHAPSASARVTLAERDGLLIVEIADDGPGGASIDDDARTGGSGGGSTGLAGLRNRVEALDGELRVTSPAGVGTAIRAELPHGI